MFTFKIFKSLILLFCISLPVSAFAGNGARKKVNEEYNQRYREVLQHFTGSSSDADSVFEKMKRDFAGACRSLFGGKIEQPSKEWTAADHNPENQQSVRIGPFLAFIDEGRVFVKDIRPDIRSPIHAGDIAMPLGGPSNVKANVKAIVLFNNKGDLAALTKDNTVYQIAVNKPSARKPATWTKINKNVFHIASLETPDGEIVLSMSSRLDPMTGKPLDPMTGKPLE